MKKLIFMFSVFSALNFYGQQDSLFVDTKYLEDQFYLGVQYGEILNSSTISNKGISYSFQVGFIKDIPINKQRNIGFGLGLGYSYDVVRPNVSIANANGILEYTIGDNLDSYRYSSNNIEIPLEFRWRSSTATKHSFWRIYSGTSLIYNFRNRAEFDTGSEEVAFSDLESWNSLNYSIYTSIGFGTWNIHIKYYLKPVFKDSTRTTEGVGLEFHPLKLGVMFYVL